MHIPQAFKLPTLLLVMIVSTALASTGCSKKEASHAAAAPPPPTVVVEEVKQQNVPIYFEYVGQTKAEETVELRARVEGILQKVYFREGAPVKKGQLLFTIDKRTFQEVDLL
jgi:membrane fusion protein (multidrug efflux system)